MSRSQLDESLARQVAAWFAAARNDPESPVVQLAYHALERQSDDLYRNLTDNNRPSSVRVFFTRCRRPYDNDREMIATVGATRMLEVTTVAADRARLHPVLDNKLGGAYDRLRAVHDLMGHVATGHGFDRHGEFVAWRAQDRCHQGWARLALATELHAEHSVYWSSGAMTEHKATLLPIRLFARALRGVPLAETV